MFVAPINVPFLSYKLITKHDSSNTKVGKHLKKKIGFPCCSTHENLSNHVPITTVGLMLRKLGGFQYFDTSQNSYKLKFNFNLFDKKIKFEGYHAIVLVKTFQ